MQRMSRICAGFAVLAMLALPDGADAQGIFRVGVGGGVTLPQAELADVADHGYHGQLMLGMNIPFFPISARVDAAYHQLPVIGEGNLRQVAVTANARVAAIGLPVTPYFIAGIGAYNTRFSGDAAFNGTPLDTEAHTDFGINGGAGILLRLGVVHAFAEGRYHHIMRNGDSMAHVPITVGIMF